MRILNLNFLSCAVKTCKISDDSFPLHPKDAELAEDDEVAYKPEILVSILPRLEWEALRTTCVEVCTSSVAPLLRAFVSLSLSPSLSLHNSPV
jgi:hypothetical protein